jgi:hypothetical protein
MTRAQPQAPPPKLPRRAGARKRAKRLRTL